MTGSVVFLFRLPTLCIPCLVIKKERPRVCVLLALMRIMDLPSKGLLAVRWSVLLATGLWLLVGMDGVSCLHCEFCRVA